METINGRVWHFDTILYEGPIVVGKRPGQQALSVWIRRDEWPPSNRDHYSLELDDGRTAKMYVSAMDNGCRFTIDGKLD